VKGRPGTTGKSFFGKGIHFLKRDVVIFAFFLLLSFFLWYLNSLRKEIETDIRYPVRYINPPAGRIAVGDLPQTMVFNIKGPGYSLVKLKLTGRRSPVSVDFSKVSYKRVPESQPPEYYIVSGSLISSFSKQLMSEFQILSIKPDTIFVTFQRKGSSLTNGKGTSPSGNLHIN
jgi:hypothetical protein